MKMESVQRAVFWGCFVAWAAFTGVFVAVLATGCGSPEEIVQKSSPAPPAETIGASLVSSPHTTINDDIDEWRWGPVLFYTNKHNIRFDQIPALEEQADYLIDNPDLFVHIDGHADERGSRLANATLSRQRAEAVRDYLLRCGVKEYQALVFSYGEDRSTGKGHSSDRRAEVEVQ